MLMFREEKSPDDEIKAWQFWHGRQHSVKQRILDAGELHSYTRSNGYRIRINSDISLFISTLSILSASANRWQKVSAEKPQCKNH
jgi:hypothetical protein